MDEPEPEAKNRLTEASSTGGSAAAGDFDLTSHSKDCVADVSSSLSLLAIGVHAASTELRKACCYRQPLHYHSTSMDEPEEEQESFSGRSLRQVSGNKCYFAEQRLCGHCGGYNRYCRMNCKRRHAKGTTQSL